jgi:hypothetical protein
MSAHPVWHLLVALAVAGIGAVSTARAEIIDIAWDAGKRFERVVDVRAGKFAEACGKLAQGDAVSWRFEASGPMDFNVHYHEGKAIVFPVKQEAIAAARGQLHVALDQDYCWMWTNKSDRDVRLRLRLAR